MITSLANWLLSLDFLSGLGYWTAWGTSLFVVGTLIFIFIALNALILVYVERKVSAFMQVRLGPMRVGPMGTLQTVADALKLLVKEDIIPALADKLLFRVGPFVILVASVVTFAAIPFSEKLLAADMNIGLCCVHLLHRRSRDRHVGLGFEQQVVLVRCHAQCRPDHLL